MSFFRFLLYFELSVFLTILFIIIIYKLFVRRNCNIAENIALKTIDNYFHAYDHNIDDDITLLHDEDLPQFNDDTKNSTGNIDLPHY